MEFAKPDRKIPFAVVGIALGIAVVVAGFGILRRTDASPGPGWIRVGSTQQIDEANVTFVAGIPAYVVATPNGLIGLYAKSPQLGEPRPVLHIVGILRRSHARLEVRRHR
jgi:hypothetical protein